MKPMISVIVPVYNSAQYLDRCLDSIRNQTLKNIEIICIDDCSHDNSTLILEAHAEEDSRISIIRHSSNLGAGAARNTGICMAKADFVAGVDSDDTIKSNMLSKLWKANEKGKYDIVCCGFESVDEAGEIRTTHSFGQRSINRHDETINIFSLLNPAFWNKLWRKSLFIDHNILFPEQEYYEDMSTTPRLVSRATQIKIIEDTLYQYMIRGGSITTTYSSKHIIDYFKGFDALLKHLDQINAPDDQYQQLTDFAHGNITYHANGLLNTSIKGNNENLAQYIKHLLLLKLSFIENYKLFNKKSTHELLELINNKETKGAFRQINTNLEQENKKLVNSVNLFKEANDKSNQESEQLKASYQKQQNLIESLKGKSSTNKTQLNLINKQLQSIASERNMVQVELIKQQEKTISLSEAFKEELVHNRHELNALLVEKDNFLNGAQKVGVSFFKLITWPFTTPSKYKKLQETPKQFFRNSKSSFAIVVARLLKLN